MNNAQVIQSGALSSSRRVLNLPAADYHAQVDVQSCSLLKPMLESPAAYMENLLSCGMSTRSMDFGTLVHMYLLEPHAFAREVAVYPAIKEPGRDSDYLSFKAKYPGRYVIDEIELARVRSACARILDQPVLGRPFGDYLATGRPEVTYFFDDPVTGVACRSRMDLDHDELLIDIKSTARLNFGWVTHAVNLSYDMQSYMYSLAECLFRGDTKPKPFVFLCVDSDEPHATMSRPAGTSFLELGKTKYEYAMALLASCKQTNYWPGQRGEEVIEAMPWHTFTPPKLQ